MVVEIDLVGEPRETDPRVDLAVSPIDTVYDAASATLTVPVHSIGIRDADPFTVRLSRDDAIFGEQHFDGLEAPVDLMPRIAAAAFSDVTEPDGIVVSVEPDETTDEITTVNNALTFRAQ